MWRKIWQQLESNLEPNWIFSQFCIYIYIYTHTLACNPCLLIEIVNYNRKEKKLNNCVNIFEVIKLLILFYSWKVLNNNNNNNVVNICIKNIILNLYCILGILVARLVMKIAWCRVVIQRSFIFNLLLLYRSMYTKIKETQIHYHTNLLIPK